MKLVQSEHGVPLTDDTEIRDRWKRYCENLYKAELDDNNSDSCPPRMGGTMELTRSREEVEKAIKALKDGTAAGPDEIPSELLKLGGDSVTSALHRIIAKVWQTGKWPEDWTQSTFVPLFKKGDPTVCANYCTISLISHLSLIHI